MMTSPKEPGVADDDVVEGSCYGRAVWTESFVGVGFEVEDVT